jgi:hypothetical protein
MQKSQYTIYIDMDADQTTKFVDSIENGSSRQSIKNHYICGLKYESALN